MGAFSGTVVELCDVAMRTQPMPERRAAHAYKPASPRRVGGPSIRYSFKDLRERWHFLAVRQGAATVLKVRCARLRVRRTRVLTVLP